jgi:hypothetical protein
MNLLSELKILFVFGKLILEKISKLFGADEKKQDKREKNECSGDYQTLIYAKRLSRKSNSSCHSRLLN